MSLTPAEETGAHATAPARGGAVVAGAADVVIPAVMVKGSIGAVEATGCAVETIGAMEVFEVTSGKDEDKW